MEEEIPDLKIKRIYLQVTEIHVEEDNIIDQIPKFGIIDPELFQLFLGLCQKFTQKYPEGSCAITPEQLLGAKTDLQNEQDLKKIFDLVDAE